MPLQLRSGSPEPTTINLLGKASLKVRPATVFEVDLAGARAGKMLAGLIQSRENAALAADLLGSEFTGGDFTSPEWLNAAAGCLIRLELATLCVSEWTGFIDDAGQVIEKPSRAMLTLLLRSTTAAPLIENAIRADVHVEVAEKNASAALPRGEAATAETTAGDVISPASPAPQAS